MTESLHGRVAWVTGGSRGIGAAVAARLEAAGATVAILDVREPTHDQPWTRCDITDPEAVGLVADALDKSIGPADILVNSAGIVSGAPIGEETIDNWERVIRANLTGAFTMMSRTFPGMAERGFGRIVSLSSGTAIRPLPGRAAYAASKAGVIALTKVAALEGAAHGVTVNAVAPGLTDTPMTREAVGGVKALRDSASTSSMANPMGAVLEADDVARCVAFLCTAEAGRITGQVLHVNAGSLMP